MEINVVFAPAKDAKETVVVLAARMENALLTIAANVKLPRKAAENNVVNAVLALNKAVKEMVAVTAAKMENALAIIAANAK